MLFNSTEFICVFLPITLIGYFALGRLGGPSWAMSWLVAASMAFYGWWKSEFLWLLIASVTLNYAISVALRKNPKRWVLAVGIAANLLALGWFKYSGFLAEAVNSMFGAGIPVPHVVLPLAISFYTFQQIAYLVDVHDGLTQEPNFLRYALFVTFFPQLIAGPIVHHKEVLPQFERPETYRPNLDNLTIGLTVFAIGLFKKVVLADSFSPTVQAMYSAAAEGIMPSAFEAWIGSFSYALQLYFDFSGYSDMAVGLGLMFGIRLPINFASPYKAASIIEFWTRWHITLTRFLTTYLYFPVTKSLTERRMRANKPLLQSSAPKLAPFVVLLVVPTLLTMALSGIWHGAGWQFLVWGALHGVMLIINHGWRHLRQGLGIGQSFGPMFRPISVLVTFTAVTVSMVFFRADSVETAMTVLQGMAGLKETPPAVIAAVQVGSEALAPSASVDATLLDRIFRILMRIQERLTWSSTQLVLLGLAIVWLLPNTYEWLGAFFAKKKKASRAASPSSFRWSPAAWRWRPAPLEGVAVGILLCIALVEAFSAMPTEFLYFTF